MTPTALGLPMVPPVEEGTIPLAVVTIARVLTPSGGEGVTVYFSESLTLPDVLGMVTWAELMTQELIKAQIREGR